MTDEHRWSQTREEAIEAFGGDQPGAQLESDIIEHFIADPERVHRAINRIATQHARSPLRSPWAVLRTDLNRATQQDVVASAASSRQKTIDRATTWIRNAGHYHATWEAAATELFGDGATTPNLAYLEQLEHDTRGNPGRYLYAGLLNATINHTREHGPRQIEPDHTAPAYTLRDDQHARDTLEAEWIKHRPRGIQAEADHEAWNQARITARDRYEQLLRAEKDKLDAHHLEREAATVTADPDADIAFT